MRYFREFQEIPRISGTLRDCPLPSLAPYSRQERRRNGLFGTAPGRRFLDGLGPTTVSVIRRGDSVNVMKVKDVSPEAFFCFIGACPAIFETDRGTYLVIGKKVVTQDRASLPLGRVSADEEVIEIPKALLTGLRRDVGA